MSPLLVLGLIEVALIIADRSSSPVDADDLRARKLMKAGWGTNKRNGLNLFTPSQDKIFRINASGFRTHDFAALRNDEVRIMLLGGSAAFGWGVADRHGIDRYLEELLSDRLEKPVRVFNLAIPAIEFPTENQVLGMYGPQLKPDVVIFYHGANDGLAWYQQTIGRRKSRQTLEPPLFSAEALIHLAYKSRLFRLASEAVGSMADPPDTSRIDVSRAIEDYDAHYKRSQTLCLEFRCVYVIQPVIFDKTDLSISEIKLVRRARLLFPLYEQMYAKYVAALLEKRYADHFDARGAVSGDSESMFLDYVHVAGAGNRRIAAFLADTLCRGLYVACKN